MKKEKETYHHSRMMINEFIANYCTRMYDKDGSLMYIGRDKRGFICNYLNDVEIPIGSLCLMTFVSHTKFYLSWYLGMEDGEFIMQSIEDHSIARCSNVAINPLPIELTKDAFYFRYSDRQFKLHDRWEKIVNKKSDSLVPIWSIFNEENGEVTLRARRKFCDTIYEHVFTSWKNVTDKEMENVVDKILKKENIE